MRFVGVLLALAALPTSSALACDISPCELNVVSPSASSLPANMVRLLFTPGVTDAVDAGAPEPRLYRLQGDARVDVPFTRTPAGPRGMWLEPAEPIAAGTTLVVEADAPTCSGIATVPLQRAYAVSEALPVPTSLGSLGVTYSRGTLQFSTISSICLSTSWVDASIADLRIELAADARPFADLFAYQTFVDGQPRARYHTNPYVLDYRPHGEERVTATCANESGDTPSFTGKHSVRFEGTLPDGTKLSTPELEIDLRCEGPAPARPDAGAVPSMADASVSPAETRDDDGCTLASGRSSVSGLLLALALLLRRRSG
ncbi:MAG: hypothetical protein ABW352_02140 [Polyangiales bacterium]